MIPVMLIEDEFLVRIGLKTCIDWSASGYEVVAEAEDGETAYELYKQKKPRLILTDVRLPHKSGIEVMREIREEDKEVRFVIISAYDDFKIAQEAISLGVEGYFVKGSLDTDELIDLLKKMRETHFGNAYSANCNQSQSISILDVYRRGDRDHIYRLLDMDIVKQELFVLLLKTKEVDVGQFSEMLLMFFEQQGAESQLWTAGESVWLFISPAESRLPELLNKLQVMIRRYVNTKVRIGVSQNFFDKGDMKESIYEAVLAADYSCAETENCLTLYSEKEHRSDMLAKASLKKIEEQLRMKQYDSCQREMEYLRGLMCTSCSVQRFYKSVLKLVGMIAEYEEEVSAYNNILEILDCEGIFKIIGDGIRKIEEKVGGDVSDNIYVAQAKAYVHASYQNQINISMIARHVHVSASYLGKVFLNETGEYLTDYVNKFRIEKAKELLAEHKYAVNEVAAKVGMADQRYFSKLFKRYCNMSPKEYENRVVKITH